MRAYQPSFAAALLAIPLASATASVPHQEPPGMDAAIKMCVKQADIWKLTFDAYYNPATGLLETNVPAYSDVAGAESWHQADFAFRKCMTGAGFAPPKAN